VALSRGMRVQTADPSDSLWAAVVAVRAMGLLLWDTVKRAGETGSGERGATGDAGWRAGAWDEQTHKQTQNSPKNRASKLILFYYF
jgi:hypothetical protein